MAHFLTLGSRAYQGSPPSHETNEFHNYKISSVGLYSYATSFEKTSICPNVQCHLMSFNFQVSSAEMKLNVLSNVTKKTVKDQSINPGCFEVKNDAQTPKTKIIKIPNKYLYPNALYGYVAEERDISVGSTVTLVHQSQCNINTRSISLGVLQYTGTKPFVRLLKKNNDSEVSSGLQFPGNVAKSGVECGVFHSHLL